MAQKTASSADLTWLLDDLVDRVQAAPNTRSCSPPTACYRLVRRAQPGGRRAPVGGGGRHAEPGPRRRPAFGGGAVRQTIIEMESAFLFVTAAGHGACLAVLAAEDADVGLIAYEMAMLVARVGKYLATPSARHRAAVSEIVRPTMTVRRSRRAEWVDEEPDRSCARTR